MRVEKQVNFYNRRTHWFSYHLTSILTQSYRVIVFTALIIAIYMTSACAGSLLTDTSDIEKMGIDPNTLSQEQIRAVLASKTLTKSSFEVIKENEANEVNAFSEKPKYEVSTIEKMISNDIPVEISGKLMQFGYDVFHGQVSTFAPVTNVPVSTDYIVGPGDTFTVTLWGRVNAQYMAEVDRNGRIVLPEVGVLNVSGMSMAAMESYLQDQISRKQTDFKMAVTIGHLRTMKIFVVGEVEVPGGYTVSSLSTVINALFAAGGPTKNGSLREIRLSRNNQKPLKIDLYKFLLGGDKSDDARLQDGDTIFVPIIGPVVGVAGNVKRPAIYEMAGQMTLKEVLEQAGGVNYAGWLRQIQVARVENHQKHIVVDFNVADDVGIVSEGAANTIIQDGDVISVFGVSLLEQDKLSASVTGEVYRPGEYRFRTGMKLSALLDLAGGPRKNAYLKTAELTRRHVSQTGMQVEKITIELEKAIAKDPSQDIELQDYDYLIIRPIPELEFDRSAVISGQVKFPGVYPVMKGEHISSLVERAGGFTDKAYLKGSIFTRESARVIQQQRLNELISQIESSMLSSAEKGASIALDEATNKAQEATLTAQKALLAKLRMTKVEGRVVIKLAEAEEFKGSKYDIELEKSDRLFVPEMSGIISVVGEVYNPTSLMYEKGRTVAYYLQRVGGPTRDADQKFISVVKADGSVVSMAQNNPDSVYWDNEGHQWNFGGFMGIRLNPGDTIVVPRKVDQFLWWQTTKDLTTILFQAALAAGVILAL